MYKTSIKFLIQLVGERPALWDKTSKLYKERSLKETSWHEIYTLLNENYEHMQPDAKLKFAKMVTKKWTHIRDSWVKSMRHGYNERTKLPPKPYVYHDELKFLQKILGYRRRRYDIFGRLLEDKNDPKQQHGGYTNDDQEVIGGVGHTISNKLIDQIEDDDDDWTAEDTESSDVVIKRETSTYMADQDITQQPQNQIKSPRSLAAAKSHLRHSSYCYEKNFTDNRHWNFFNGILLSLNTLDDDHTLQFQAGVITLIQKLKASQKQLPNASRKRRKIRGDEDNDNEWPMHKLNIPNRYSTRSAKQSNDPIANLEAEGEQDSGSANIEYF